MECCLTFNEDGSPCVLLDLQVVPGGVQQVPDALTVDLNNRQTDLHDAGRTPSISKAGQRELGPLGAVDWGQMYSNCRARRMSVQLLHHAVSGL